MSSFDLTNGFGHKLSKLVPPILVVGNKIPDADSMASALCLVDYFLSKGLPAVYYVVAPPTGHGWMLQSPHCDPKWITFAPPPDFNSLVVVDDCLDPERLGISHLDLANKRILVVDHHESNRTAKGNALVDIHWVDAPSTASILADFGFTFPLLYAGMYADTLGFSVRSFQSLISVGAFLDRLPSDPSESLVQRIEDYNTLLNPQENIGLLEAFLDGEAVFITGTIGKKTYSTAHLAVDVGDKGYYPLLKVLSPFADLYSLTDLRTGGTSIRSKHDDFNALMFCQIYGGGGHVRASGCNVTSFGLTPLAGFRNLCAQVERKLVGSRVRAYM